MHLHFWQPIPSFHQEAFLNALALADWVESVQLYYESEMPKERLAEGWPKPNFQGVHTRAIRHGETPIDAPDTFHFFTGFHTHRQLWGVFDRLSSPRHARCYSLTEAPALYGWKRLPRQLIYRLHASKLGSRLDGLFAIGGKAETFYRALLPKKVPVHPFAYYDTPAKAFPAMTEAQPRKTFRFLYVGRLVHLKGIDRLFDALASLPDSAPRWQLTLLGSGPEKESLKQRAIKRGISKCLSWHDSVPADEVAGFYRNADVLVQPSRGDGWGMTVVESLRQGCEVMVTEACGAAVAARPGNRLGPNWRTWTPILHKQMEAGPLTFEQRCANQARAKAYTAEAGVETLKAILSQA